MSVCVQRELVREGQPIPHGLQDSRSGAWRRRAKERLDRAGARTSCPCDGPLRAVIAARHLLDGAAHDERSLIFVGDRR